MRKSKTEKSIIRVLSAVIIVAMLLSACSGKEESGVRTIRDVTSRNTISTECQNPAGLHYSAGEEAFTEKIAASGLIELYVDKATNSFCIADSGKKQLWSALPLLDTLSQNESPASDPSMAALRIIGGTDVYYLNTQDNSLAYGKASYSPFENGVEFSYDIFADSETAKKTSFSTSDIAFNLKINVALADGNMNVNCTCSNISKNPNAYIESIELLNYFGAYNDSAESDYLFVPDGCGAIIRTSVYDESFEKLSFAVYGSDPACEKEYSGSALVPAFGIKHGEAAFVSLIRKGDTAAVIHADKASGFADYNRVYPSFNITPSAYENETLNISKSSSVQELSLCYRFLYDKNATYSGLASACREQLIRDSVLSSQSVNETAYLPFFLTLTGAVSKNSGPFRILSRLTTFEQAQDMLIRMKSKGINNVALRYTGVFGGGTDSTDASHTRLLARLGGSQKLSELFSYISAQKMSLYLDIDILSSASGFGSNSALNINKQISDYKAGSKLVEFLGSSPASRELIRISKLSKVIKSVLTDTKYYDFSGFCINDAGSVLYSDFSYNGMLRDSAASEIRSAISPLSTSRPTMAVKGNIYMLKNIDSVINVPLDTTVSASGAYLPVPFIQLILHGEVDYAGDPINVLANGEENMLHCIEFGACPHYEWNYDSSMDESENDIYYYDNTINSAAEFYKKANEALNDLRSARMTDHYEVQDGVFCTEYDTGAKIYVNYTDSECSVMGAVVEARSFLKIN